MTTISRLQVGRATPLHPAGLPALAATRRWFAQRGLAGVLAASLAGALACTPTADDSKLPPEVQDPKTLHTPAGALELYQSSLLFLPDALDEVMVKSAILTDELAAMPTPLGIAGAYIALDSRLDLTSASEPAYTRLHHLRAQAREARGFLAAYATDTATARELEGHLYAAEAYADVLLADLFCSGIPLSTVDFQGDYTLKPGSTTRDVYRAAVGLFDSALALIRDSVAFQRLAAVGKGRALLGLGVYDSAALAVAAVPTDFRYQLVAPSVMASNNVWSMYYFAINRSASTPTNFRRAPGVPGVGDREGQSGLDYLSSGDPRTGGTLRGTDLYGHDYYFPTKYSPVNRSVALMLADGIEARLIQAEAVLQAGDAGWLATLNALRTDGTFDTQPNAADTTKTDTLWHAGTGGVPGLRPLDDPATAEARVDLLFRERAFWLYLTAHRQGDLRRMIRQYGRAPESIYPTGAYPGADGRYGGEIVVPVPETEHQLNPQYTGCNHRGA